MAPSTGAWGTRTRLVHRSDDDPAGVAIISYRHAHIAKSIKPGNPSEPGGSSRRADLDWSQVALDPRSDRDVDFSAIFVAAFNRVIDSDPEGIRSKPRRMRIGDGQGSQGGDPDMTRRHRFMPSARDQLEVRVVLSQTTLGLSTVVSGLSHHLRVLNRKQTALIAEVNQSFDSFQSDFDQARATFFSSLQTSPSTDSSAVGAFQEYTQQRTLLLAQQLVSSFVQTPQGTAKAPSQPYALKQLVETKVIGPKGKGPAGSLIASLNGTIQQISDSMPAASPTTTLYTLSQDNAIETARTAMLNGVSIMKSGAFGIQKNSHY
jgi:hypothetical protein